MQGQDEATQAELDYFCALRGHLIVWDDTGTEGTVPPGTYICQQCHREVVLPDKEGER